MGMEEVLEEEAPLEEAQKEEVPEDDRDESAVDGCVVSKQREYGLVGKKEQVEVADRSVESFSQEESEFCWR